MKRLFIVLVLLIFETVKCLAQKPHIIIIMADDLVSASIYCIIEMKKKKHSK